uniref:Endonuclease/exonuclease/phosphatase domain-containing protein n=1 Tax=Oryza meridionalis TaxID=40149 RepID=A0A0E0E083_9ORYZ
MASAAPRARLTPPTPAIHPHRKRARSPPAPGSLVRCSSSGNGAPRDHRRRWQSPAAGAPGRVYQRHRAQQYGVPSRRFRDIAAQMENRGYQSRFKLNRAQKLVVGNIHVLFNPKRGDVKLGQIRMLLEKANALAEKWGGIPIVLAGDFNSTPDFTEVPMEWRRSKKCNWVFKRLECSRVLDTLPVGFLRRTRGLPTREIGSDHLPIIAEFVFTESAASTDSDQEDESDEDKESEQEATRGQHVYFSSDSDSSDEVS